MRRKLTLFAFAALLAVPGLVALDTPKEPIYIYLYARITDHVNLGVTEDRLHRLLPLLQKYRQAYPEAHFSATLLFSGAVSEALSQRNSQNHLLDFVRDYISRGIVQVGYDGTDEPTYLNRPVLNFYGENTSEDRWVVREITAERFLTEARDALTGVVRPGKEGGLQEMRSVFGAPSAITGLALGMNVQSTGPQTRAILPDEMPDPHFSQPLTKRNPPMTGLRTEVGGDSEVVRVLRRYNIAAMMVGIPDTNPGYVPGFSQGKESFGKFMSPDSQSSPEVFWQDDVLRSSESSGTTRLVRAYDGADAMKAVVGKADRSRIHVIHVELANEQNHVSPAFMRASVSPLKYAYDHPQAPELPPGALLPADRVDEAYANEDAVLKWLSELFSSDPGSRVVSPAELMQMTPAPTGFSVSIADLRAALPEYLRASSPGESTILPSQFKVDDHYLSLANLFQVLTDALAEFSHTGKLPESVKVVQVYGPVRLFTGHGPNEGELSAASIARVCAQIAAGLHDQSPGKLPKNAIPSSVQVDGITVNPAQFLRLMGLALTEPPDVKIPVRMLYAFNGPLISFPKENSMSDAGFGWTLKPAPFTTARTK